MQFATIKTAAPDHLALSFVDEDADAGLHDTADFSLNVQGPDFHNTYTVIDLALAPRLALLPTLRVDSTVVNGELLTTHTHAYTQHTRTLHTSTRFRPFHTRMSTKGAEELASYGPE
jgi:hypothetical protein